MKIRSSVFLGFAAFALLFANFSAYAADSVSTAGSHPLWRWLGLSQDWNKPCDGRVNKSGARYYEPCPTRQICPEKPSPAKPGESVKPGELPGTQPPGEKAPGEAAAGEAATPPSNALASNYGASSGPLSFAPNMIGDQFGGGLGTSKIVRNFTVPTVRSFTFGDLHSSIPISQYLSSAGSIVGTVPDFYTINSNGTLVALNHVVTDQNGNLTTINVINYNDAASRLGGTPLTAVPAGGSPAGGTTTISGDPIFTSQFNVLYNVNVPVVYDVNIPSPGGAVGRMKIADDTSPMPRDRLIFDYNYFDGVPLSPGGVGVNRFTPGFEKTFASGWMSIEMKCPMATTLDSTIVQDGVTNTSNGEFGNLVVTWKTLLFRHETWAMSGGLSVAAPTADNVNVVTADGTPLVQILNRSTHLGPFLGFLWTPNERWFAQGFLQYDVAANGKPVLINPSTTPAGLTSIGEIVDTPFQYVDLGVGYWAYRGHERFRRMTGWAFTSELHWNRSLRETDVVESGAWRIGDFSSSIETFNLTLGTHIELYDTTTITFGYTVPLGGGLDREFNGELRLMVNRRFGSQNRLTQATF